ncbi:MAG: class I SAM-dependent methyltransferase [Oscillospiraceae bacterium]
MNHTSMTALISLFARAYHAEHYDVKIFDDSLARALLSDEEYRQISHAMSGGISFFNPDFQGSSAEALRWVVDNQLSPSPLGRAAFAEQALERAVAIGARQYLILGAGYDTFAYRRPAWAQELPVFEIDQADTAEDKIRRLQRAGIAVPDHVQYIHADLAWPQWQASLLDTPAFDRKKISFCSLLGLIYYLSVNTFGALIDALASIMPKGSSLVFDYPDENSFTEHAGTGTQKQAQLAQEAQEAMQACYSCADMEKILASHGFLIYEHLTPDEITNQYFKAFNRAQPLHPMRAFDNVNYCLAVKQ